MICVPPLNTCLCSFMVSYVNKIINNGLESKSEGIMIKRETTYNKCNNKDIRVPVFDNE